MTTVLEAAQRALRDEMRRNPRIWVLGEDVRHGGVFGQYKGLFDEFGPERVVDTPIAEATIVGASVGAALVGTRPVVETRFSDFALSAIDELVNQAAKNRFMFGGQGRVPMLVRMPSGLRNGSAAQHSQSLEAWFAHIPGLVVTAPATPADAAGLLLTALRCNDPVIHMEAKELWRVAGGVDNWNETVPFGVGRVARPGSDVTVVAWSTAVKAALEAAELLEESGVSAEVIDLRTIWPWDRDLVLSSAARTRRLVVVHESVKDGGFGAEITATAAEALWDRLSAPICRIAAPRVPVGYAETLENVCRITSGRIASDIAALFSVKLKRRPKARTRQFGPM